MRFLAVASMLVGLTCCASIAHAQGGTADTIGMGGLEKYVRVGGNSYSGQSMTNALQNGAAAGDGQAMTLDNGYPVGSIENSGILSTQVPAGGGVNVDLNQFSGTWGTVVAPVWKWAYTNAMFVFPVAIALILAMKFCFAWLARLAGGGSE